MRRNVHYTFVVLVPVLLCLMPGNFTGQEDQSLDVIVSGAVRITTTMHDGKN